MESAYPKYPANSNPSDPAPRKWWRQPRNLMLISLAGIVLLGLVVALVMHGSTGKKDAPSGPETASTTYYDRAGFDRKKLSTAIGDPAALATQTAGTPVTYKGTKVIQACSVIAVEDVRQAGLKIYPNSLTALERNYFDGQSQASLDVTDIFLPGLDDSNSCSYILDPKGAVTVDVYQPPYVSVRALDYEIGRRYQDSGTIEGMKTFTRTSEDNKYYIIRNGDSAIQVRLEIHNNEQAAQKVLQTAAQNFKKLMAAPTGPVHFVFDSPTFKKSYLNGCDVSSASDVQSVFQVDPKPLVTERVATATGVIKFTNLGSEKLYNYIDHDCVRRVAVEGYRAMRSLSVESKSYLSDEPAKLDFTSHKKSFDKKVTAISATVGDEAYFSYTTGQNKELVFRKGRFVVNVGINDDTRTTISDQDLIQILVPLAQTINGRIKDF